MSDISRILREIAEKDPGTADELLPLVYDELRALARSRLSHEKPGQTLQTTALVHEAYLRLVGTDEGTSWESRGHFFAAAAEAMRRILIDQARRKLSLKRGAGRKPLSLESAVPDLEIEGTDSTDLLALDEALRKFEQEDPFRAQVVKLHYFAGLTLSETAQAMSISLATVKRHWVYARAWLFGRLRED